MCFWEGVLVCEFHMAFKDFETRNSVVGPEGPVLLAESREAGQLLKPSS